MVSSVEWFGIGVLAFWAVIYAFKGKLEKRGFKVYPFFLMWRKGTRSEWFPGVANSNAYKGFEKVAIALGITSMVGGIFLIYYVISGLLVRPTKTGIRLEPIIPGVTIGLNEAIYVLLAIGISVVVHELMHAISATSNKVKVRGGGFILIVIFPGAFVEPDEEEFQRSPTSAKLKIIASGIAMNLILAAVFFPIATYLPSALSQGIEIVGVLPHSEAYNISLHPGQVIEEINEHVVRTYTQLSQALDSSTHYLIVVKNPNGTVSYYNATAENHFLGVEVTYSIPPSAYPFLDFSIWMFVVNFSLALFNGAPLFITDGGKIFTELVKKISSRYGEKISYYIQTLLLVSFVFAILLSISLPQ
ncbi:MAG: site-2 protease family protein [Candidatus Aramenus sp.]|jgi:membrane-associated protease RseP (regulator of RpoE activity)|nr:site-2 protease family protein [Candidatus Aramenus sp.]